MHVADGRVAKTKIHLWNDSTVLTIKQTALIGSDNIAKAQLFALSNPLPGSLDFSN
jgi:hypothetical protein